MDLSRRLRSTALIFFIYIALVPLSSARFHEIRHKRQNGARMYLPESFIIPGDEGDPGDWSEWSSPSECSRSCGGGVSYQTRECLRIESNGAALCSGGNRKYFSCNTQDCPEEEPDFRSQQCSRFDKVPFDGVYYNWVPYTNAPNPCELNCMPVGERFYFHQKEKVIDGTRCNDKDLDVCVDGLCQPVGCDMMLGSDAKEDKCRKCGGDGSTCKTISDTLTTNNLAAGYNDILLIPSGATNIRIQETAPSNNYLACRNLSSHYYLNGNWRIDFPRPMFYAGSWWNYQRKPTGFAAPDYLTCSGPITESIYIVMLVQDRNVSINYEYSIPTSVIQNTPDVYSWTHMEFEPCSASCGGGTQTRTVTCNNRMSLGEVDPSLCDLKAKPAETQECGQEPCAPSWIEGEWGKCSKGCGEDGFQNRMVTCERISPNGEQTVEEDAVCLQLAGNKPATTMECNRDVKNCPKYHLGPWKPCDKLCGEGKQVRKVTCYIEENGRKKILPESECVEEKPETEKSCMLTPCEGVDWIISQWSGCDACGQNVETRTAICGSKSGKVYSEEFCGPEVPLLSRPCKSPKCPTQWFSSEWSKCSAACGKGVKSRVVLCGIFNGQSITTASNESECDASSKPESEQECEGEEKECPGEWFTGPWGACSEPCGGGERVREVLCLANGTKSSNCDQTKLQFASEKCNTHACSDDEVIPVDSTAKPLESEDDDEDECDEDTSEFDVEFVTDKMSADLKISEGISLDDETTTSSSLITDELMLSDAPSSDETELDESSTDISLSTIEGSGESTDSTDLTSLGISEGSGDETDATTEFSDSTTGSSIDSVTSASTTSIEAVSSSSTEFSTGLTDETEASSSSTVGADASTKSTDVSETSEESSQTTSKYSTTDALSTTETSEKSSETTNEDSTTDSISTDVSSESTVKSTDITGVSDSTTGLSLTEVTESTLMFSGSTEISSESTSSDGSLSTDDTTLENTKSTDLLTTDASSSSESSTDDLTSETSDSSLVSSESTASSSSDTSKSTEADTSESTDTSVSTESDTTESTDTLATDTTSSTQSDTTESSDTSSTDATSSTESDTTESTDTSSTDATSSTESDTTESTDTSSTDTTSSTESDTTESTDTSSTDASLSTKSDTTEITSDVTSTTSSDLSSDLTTDDTSSIESSTSSSSETSEVSPVSSSSSGSTQVSDETTPSNTVSTDLSTESSYGTTLSSSSIDTDSTDDTTEPPNTDTTDVSESSDATTISSSVESDSTAQITTSSSDSTVTTDISETTPSSSASSTEAKTTDIASSKSTSVTDTTTLTTSSGDLSEQTTDLSESTTDLSKLMTDSSTGSSDSLTESSKFTTDSSESTTEILESSSISLDLTTDSTDLTTDSSDLATDSSDLTTVSSGLTTDSSDLATDSSDLTTLSSGLTTVSSEATESSTIGLTTVSSSSSDLSLSTDETTVDFWSSTNTDEIEETSEKSTPNTLQSVITKETKLRKCQAKKTKKDCNKKQFGCCPDKVTAAKGPFDEGCPVVKTCAETEFGCCLDGVSPAQDKQLKGCPSSQCAETLFGCCPDKFTPAEGEDNEGCPEPTTLPPTTTNEEITDISTETTETTESAETAETTDSTTVESEDTSTETTTEQEEFVKSCSFAEFGCCPDGKTEAKGDNFMGCDSVVDSKDCSKSIHGCCHDGRTFATGPDGQGCASCTREPFGCCQDNQTPAHGPLGEGCCLNSAFGCCPDNINFAYGPNFEGCDCTHTPYGCCPDKKQAARGYNNEGCSCETLKFGCCPDKITPATGPKFEGCACHTMQYGCCPDGTTLAQGPHHYGCHCSQSKFKCCQDEKTSAKGPDYEGCSCLESKFGCCPDGVTSAQGEKFEGCENVKEPPQKACGLPKEAGNCTSFAIKHYFDTEYGACNRFWYGGCGGNDNKFETEAHCKATCQDYKGKEACLLPKSSGPCTAYNKKFYFNSDRNRCEEFNYGGCYGTSNRFDSIEECQALCTVSESIPPCEQPVDEGPCEGNFERWFYDNETDVCQPFRYGGCKGNKNNYPTEHSCNYNCRQPGVHKDYCSLPKQTGDCSEQHARWHYSESDKKCMPFYYTGCGGNKNNFRSLESCEDHCPKEVAKDVCEIPAEVGECQNYTSMWYYDTKDERCRQFYYGGCGGNGNKFQTEAECLQRCEHKPEETPVPEPERQTPEQSVPPAPSPSTGDICAEQPDVGSCRNFTIEWYFDAEKSRCNRFYYGGCEGNENRFSTEEECAQRCSSPKTPVAPPNPPQEANICESPSDYGSCQENIIMWFFNAKEGQCQRFYYGGCDGNENRFETEQECSQRCSEPKVDIDTRFAEPSEVEAPPDNKVAPSDEEICLLTPVSGDCNDNITRWFYKSAEGLCDEFMYSGCGGNGNNFDSEDACQNSCYHVQTTCTLPPVPGRCDDNLARWYFDERAGSCYEFEFTGCRGNRNNFVTEAECMDFCAVQPNQPEKGSEPVAPVYSLCELPVEAGECENNTLAWFYDTETMLCTAFTYTGCGGNGNRFESKEQCDRQCGEFKGIDVCNEPVQTGPCRQWQARFHFNKESRSCEPFTYGGCDGTGNRFVLRSECESLCIVGQEPQTTANKDICKIPVNSGKCEGQSIDERRWYYDDERGTCISFIYAGCSGNQNNFRSYESCINFCTNPEESNERTNEIIPDRCESYESECQQLRCQYGVQRTTVEDNCTRCGCINPCEQHSCPEGQQCAVDITSDTSRQFEPVCRSVNKPGECPILTSSSTNCARECYTDADCRGDNKCCADGCGFVCVRPTVPTQATIRPTTPLPAVIYPGEVQVSLEPKKPQELDVQTAAGGIAVLRCFATGIPAPNVTWSRHNVVIDTNQGRYVLTSSGDLTIVQVRQTDTGSYVCIADNGLGAPVQREVKLQVTEPQQTPAYIFGNKNFTQIVTLNSRALVRCPAGGHPAPQVSWWRNKKRLGLIDKRFEMTRDYALMFHAVQLSDLGVYTCEAYNHRQRPVSMKITLKAVGPARAVNRNDVPFLKYVIDPATAPITPRPIYPYRPTRPYAPPPPPVVIQQPQLVSARAVLVRDPRNTYSLGSTVLLACEVQGYPVPNVVWTKDGVPLSAGERIQITADPHRLVINDVITDDTGLYGCTARNSFSYNTSEEKVVIESVIPVHPDCVDNPHFANCNLIVKGNYCTHQYYAKFCCRSCTLAGQLRGAHPNAV